MICVFVFHIGFYLWFVFLYSTLDYLGFVFLYSTLDFIYDLCFCIPHWILLMICVFVFHIGFCLWFVFLYSTLDFIYDLCFVFHIGFYIWFVFLYSTLDLFLSDLFSSIFTYTLYLTSFITRWDCCFNCLDFSIKKSLYQLKKV